MTNSGAATTGKMIAKQPKPQRQFVLYMSLDAAAPANAVIIYGEEVKA